MNHADRASDERLRVIRWLERRRQPLPTDDDALALFAQELIAFHPTSWQEEADCLTAALEVGSYLLSALDAAGHDGDGVLRKLRLNLVQEAIE